MADSQRIDDLRRRVQKDPASIAFAQLAEECRRAGQHQEAVDVCHAGLALHPAYLSARVTLGRALIELNDLDTALTEATTVLKSAPENLAAIRGVAEIHHRRGELAEALAQYRAALALARNDPDLQQTVAELARQIEPPPPPASADGLSFEQMQDEFLKLAPPPSVAPRAKDAEGEPPSAATPTKDTKDDAPLPASPAEDVDASAETSPSGPAPVAIALPPDNMDAVSASEPAPVPAVAEVESTPLGDPERVALHTEGAPNPPVLDSAAPLAFVEPTSAGDLAASAPEALPQSSPALVADPEEQRQESVALHAEEEPELTALDSSAPFPVEEWTIDEPALDEPATAEPATAEPAIDEPVIDEPAIDELAIDELAVDEPAIDQPALQTIAALERWLDAIHVARAERGA